MDLSRLTQQAESHSEFIAAKLAAHQQTQHLDDAELATQLDCSLDGLTHLRLCALPRPDYFEDDVARIAEHVHADVARLTLILQEQKRG